MAADDELTRTAYENGINACGKTSVVWTLAAAYETRIE